MIELLNRYLEIITHLFHSASLCESFHFMTQRLLKPNYIQGMFTLHRNGYSLRGHHKVVIPRSSYMLHSFKYQACKQWNYLPDKIRMSESLSIFRKILQNILLSSSYDCNCMFICKYEVCKYEETLRKQLYVL